MSMLYLLVLIASIACIMAIDARWRLALFWQPRRALIAIGIAMAVFIAWDLLGIGLGIFFTGDSPYVTGILLLPELPIEELFFLFLLSYIPLVLYNSAQRLWPRT